MRHPQTTGFLALLALHAIFFFGPAAFYAEWSGLKPEAGRYLIGVVQVLYVIPLTLLVLKLRYPEVAKGIVKAAVVTFLVNMAGCGFMLLQISKIDG